MGSSKGLYKVIRGNAGSIQRTVSPGHSWTSPELPLLQPFSSNVQAAIARLTASAAAPVARCATVSAVRIYQVSLAPTTGMVGHWGWLVPPIHLLIKREHGSIISGSWDIAGATAARREAGRAGAWARALRNKWSGERGGWLDKADIARSTDAGMLVWGAVRGLGFLNKKRGAHDDDLLWIELGLEGSRSSYVKAIG